MNQLTEHEIQAGKIKFYVTHIRLKEGQIRIEFRRWPGDLIVHFSVTVHESKVDEAMQEFQEWAIKDEERQQEIARRLYGEK